jgi:hypothetical protein
MIYSASQFLGQSKKSADQAIMIRPVKFRGDETGTISIRASSTMANLGTGRRWMLFRSSRVATTGEQVQSLAGK